MDWNQIKAEYISGGTSYRKLAEKYKVSFNTLKDIAVQGKWYELKQKAHNDATTKIVNSVAKDIASNSLKINKVADKLLDKISNIIEKHEEILYNSQSLKHITSALKDIKDIKGLKSDIDLREQEARINKLRKEAMDEEKDTTVEVVMDDEVDEYAN